MKPTKLLASLAFLAALASCSGDGDVTGVDPDDDYPYPVGKVFFSHPPIGLEGVFYFESMGALFTPYQEDHGGFFHVEQFADGETTIPVLAPADGQVVVLRTHEGIGAENQYAIHLRVSTTTWLLWGHVGRLSDRLASEAPPLGSSRNVRIPVTAGEVIGYVAKQALDLAVNDESRQAQLLHPEFYSSNPNAVPLEDYYLEPLRSQLIGLTVRDAEPRTGRMGHDVAGTLAGLWFREGSDPTVFRDDHAFHFGYHHLLTRQANIVDGLAFADDNKGPLDVSLWNFWVKGNPRMEDITPASGVVKLEMYPSRAGITGSAPNWTLEDVTGLDDRVPTWSILLVEMLDDDTIRLERFDATESTGISPDDVTGFTADARTYHRNPLG
jgi:hypothetical protein